jgi:uncharacterized protein YbjT (DUF2867 family)
MTHSNTQPVLVIGATGRTGRCLVAELLRAGRTVRALVRNPATSGLSADVELVTGDLTDADSIARASEGAQSAFLVWTAPFATAPDVVSALARHVERIVLLSSPHQTPHPFFQQPNRLAVFHAELDRMVIDSGRAWTIVRPGMFAANSILWWASQIEAGDKVRWPYADVETAPIDERDIAAVAARALLEAGHAGRDYVVTGPAPLTHAEQVRAIGNAIGRRLVFHELTPEEFRSENALRFGPAANMLLAAWGAAVGIPAYVTSTVADVAGTPARSFAEWAVANAGAFGVSRWACATE